MGLGTNLPKEAGVRISFARQHAVQRPVTFRAVSGTEQNVCFGHP